MNETNDLKTNYVKYTMTRKDRKNWGGISLHFIFNMSSIWLIPLEENENDFVSLFKKVELHTNNSQEYSIRKSKVEEYFLK